MSKNLYTEDSIRSLDWKEHIRLRPGMYIGKMGDGSSQDDGIYILLKEVIDNSIDEYVMGNGKSIDISIKDNKVTVRDFGRGIPLGKLIDCVSKINTGGKYDSEAFQKSVGLNGVGLKAVNALSTKFQIESYREGEIKQAEFMKGENTSDSPVSLTEQKNGTLIRFEPDNSIFKNYNYIPEYLEDQIWNYAYLNSGLTLNYNGKKYHSENGLLDLLENKTDQESIRYPIIHFKGKEIECAMTHTNNYGEEYYSFVNGQYTTQGGTHLAAFREAVVRTIREFFKKDYDATDIRASISGAVAIRVQEPVFESQTKTKLGSLNVSPKGQTVRAFVNEFVKKELDNFLHKNSDTARAIQKRIIQSERERKEIAGIKKLANERAKKAKLHNKKLRDCRIHYNDKRGDEELKNNSMIFITEGDSASGSITKSRDVQSQAVFSLRGKPFNCFGHTKKIVYENEEFNLLQHALNIEDGLEGLRYKKIIIATDADVDGMHIRLLIITFFLQFYPELIKNGHLYILQTPIFRVRNKDKTHYCYSESEKNDIINNSNAKFEITRFKGLGEISPNEFKNFIGDDIKLDPVIIDKSTTVEELLTFYMGKNTPDRQQFIIDNLKVELDLINENLND